MYKDYNREREFRTATKLQHRDPLHDENLLKSIESIYFEATSASQCEDHIIYNLPKAILDVDFLISEKNRLKKQLSVVSRKVSELMLQHQPEYNEELQRVIDLQILLNDAINLTSQSRANLKLCKSNVTHNILTIIYNERRRPKASKLLDLLIERKENLSSSSPVHENLNESTKGEVITCDQINGAGSSNSSPQNCPPQSTGNSPVINNSKSPPSHLSFANDSRDSHLPLTQSFDSLISSNIEKTVASTSANLAPLGGRSNSLSPVSQIASGANGCGGVNSSSANHSPASR